MPLGIAQGSQSNPGQGIIFPLKVKSLQINHRRSADPVAIAVAEMTPAGIAIVVRNAVMTLTVFTCSRAKIAVHRATIAIAVIASIATSVIAGIVIVVATLIVVAIAIVVTVIVAAVREIGWSSRSKIKYHCPQACY